MTISYGGSWALVETGIFFGTPRPSIDFLDFSTGRINEIVKLENELILFTPNVTVSPDGRHLIYSQVGQASSDIMLVENFR
jgi:hypothetical protein